MVHVHHCYANFCNKVVTHDARKLVAILSGYGSTWKMPMKAFQVYNCLSLSYCSSGGSSEKEDGGPGGNEVGVASYYCVFCTQWGRMLL